MTRTVLVVLAVWCAVSVPVSLAVGCALRILAEGEEPPTGGGSG